MSKEQKPRKAKQPGRVKHDRGLADYLKMGPDRSLKRLWTRYCETMATPPALVTIESWSQRFAWVAKAKAFDERLAARLQEKAADTVLEETWDQVSALKDLARKALDKAIAGFDRGEIMADSAYEIQALLNSTVTALKHVELISGRPTGRFGSESIRDLAPDWIKEALKRLDEEKKELQELRAMKEEMEAIVGSSDEPDAPADATRH